MLTAVLHGKAARVAVDGQDISWRELFRKREDLMTAAFFGRLLYLSSEMRLAVLSLLVGPEAAAQLADIENVTFWPSLRKATKSAFRIVEPDVVIECKGGLVVVEVKPPTARQVMGQWENEITALSDSRTIGHDPGFMIGEVIHFVALGGNHGQSLSDVVEGLRKYPSTDESESFEKHFDLTPHQREWSELLNGIFSLEAKTSHDRAVMEDWFSAFALFNLRKPIKPLPEVCALMPILNEHSFNLLEELKNHLLLKDKVEKPRPFENLLPLLKQIHLEGICKYLQKQPTN